MRKDLVNCKAVLVSASAPRAMVEAFVEAFNDDAPSNEFPFILVADNCGTNDRKKQLVLDVLDEIVPTVVSGRLGDIFSVAQGVIEKSKWHASWSFICEGCGTLSIIIILLVTLLLCSKASSRTYLHFEVPLSMWLTLQAKFSEKSPRVGRHHTPRRS